MTKIIKYFIAVLIFYSQVSYAQIIPTLEFTTGLVFPAGQTGGELVYTNDSGISNISNNFIKDNYANSAGITIFGSLKIPFASNEIVSGLISGGYTYFNIFRTGFNGVGVINNTQVAEFYDSRFSVSTFGFGIEVNPASKSKFSPFINSSFTINMLSLSVERNNFNYAFFNDAFRLGVMSNAGISVKINNEYKFTISGNYTLANLLLKSSSSDFEDRVQFGRENIPINDGEGEFYSNLSNPDSIAEPVNGSKKNVNWWGINLGLNIVLGKSGKK